MCAVIFAMVSLHNGSFLFWQQVWQFGRYLCIRHIKFLVNERRNYSSILWLLSVVACMVKKVCERVVNSSRYVEVARMILFGESHSLSKTNHNM